MTTATPAASLLRHDFLRTPILAVARPEAFKEWHHYLVQAADLRVLVNFSLMTEAVGGAPPALVPRVVVIADDGRWSGAVARFPPADVHLAADLCGLRVGGSSMRVDADGFHVLLDLPDQDIHGELRLTPGARPQIGRVHNQAVGDGRISWLFVPRLRATGWLRVGATEHRLDETPAYHDHNWGHFSWGDDFGWEWGSLLPVDPADPWSVVFTRTTDRRRLRCLSQALYVWHHDEPAALFRDGTVAVRSHGLLGRGPDCTLPPPMRLVLGGAAADVPASVEITATDPASGDRLHAEFRPRAHARLAQPSELRPDRSVVLSEISGTARLTGSIGGRDVDGVAAGVVELLHG